MISTFLIKIRLALECLIQLNKPPCKSLIVSTWPLIIIKLQMKCDFILLTITYYSLSFMPMVNIHVLGNL